MRKQYVQGRLYYRIEADEIKTEMPKLMPNGYVKGVNLHWTAGAYGTGYKAYQILIGEDYILVSATLLYWNVHQHTWRRNSNRIGVSFMALAGANERNMGRYPLTREMIERCALVVGMIQNKYNFTWSEMLDHAYWAIVDGYKGYRWDIRMPLPFGVNETAYDSVLRKSKWYASKL
jgi:hypothetical protein